MNALRRALRPVRLRLRWIRLLKGLMAGALAGAAACVALSAASFFIPVRHRIALSCLTLAAGGLLGALGNGLRPVSDAAAAVAADGCGLAERVQTALQLARREDDFARLQREDALRALDHLPLRKIALPRLKRPLLIAAGLIFIAGGLMLLPNAQNAAVEAALAFEGRMREAAQALEAQAQRDVSDLDAAQQEDLTQTLRETAAALRRAEEPVDALLALNEAQRRMEDLRSRMADAVMGDLLDALERQGMQELSRAVSGGDEAQIARALEGADAQALARAMADAQALAQAMADADPMGAGEGAQAQEAMDAAAQEMQEAMGAAAQEMQAGRLSEAAASLSGMRQAAQTQAANRLSDAARALSHARQAVSEPANLSAQAQRVAAQAAAGATRAPAGAAGGENPSGSADGQSGSGAAGSGGSGAAGQSGSGAGTGSQADGESSGAGEGAAQVITQGSAPPRKNIAEYESIYDPTRLNAQTRDEFAASPRGEGASAQVELGPGAGTQGGSVPYNEVVGEYAQAAAQAAEHQNLTAQERDWVARYFEALTGS